MLCYAVLCYAVICCAMLCYAVLCCAMLCYAVLCCHIAVVCSLRRAGCDSCNLWCVSAEYGSGGAINVEVTFR